MPVHLLPISHIRQQNDGDCLVACAQMVLEYMGVHVPYERLKRILEVAAWGTPHSSIHNLSRHIPKLIVNRLPGDLPDLWAALTAGKPPIVFVWTGELPYVEIISYHAIVLAGYDEEYFYVHDPALPNAPIKVLQGDVALAWIAHNSHFATLERA